MEPESVSRLLADAVDNREPAVDRQSIFKLTELELQRQ